MENMLSDYTHPDYVPCHSYKPAPVTGDEFATAVDQIEVEHEKNAGFLKNPYPAIKSNEFHKLVSTAQQLAQDLSIWESRGLPLVQNNLAHGQGKSSCMEPLISVLQLQNGSMQCRRMTDMISPGVGG